MKKANKPTNLVKVDRLRFCNKIIKVMSRPTFPELLHCPASNILFSKRLMKGMEKMKKCFIVVFFMVIVFAMVRNEAISQDKTAKEPAGKCKKTVEEYMKDIEKLKNKERISDIYLKMSDCYKSEKKDYASDNCIWRYSQLLKTKKAEQLKILTINLAINKADMGAFSRLTKVTSTSNMQNQLNEAKKLILEEGITGWHTLANGDYDKAIESYKKSIELGKLSDFRKALVYYDLSLAYEKKKLKNEAIESMEHFIKLMPFDNEGSMRLKLLNKK